jgi:hypothetical protein
MDAHATAITARPRSVRSGCAAGMIAFVVVVLLGACATTQPYAIPPPTIPPSVPSPLCPPTGVLLQAGEVDAAMGLRALGVTLTNCGPTPYEVDSYPQVRALDEDRDPIALTVLTDVGVIAPGIPIAGATPQPLTLQPGERAGAAIVWRNKYDDISAPPVAAPYLQVAPQAGRLPQLLAPDGGLDLGSTGRLAVSPWIRTPSHGPTPSWTPPTSAPPIEEPPPTEEPPLL